MLVKCIVNDAAKLSDMSTMNRIRKMMRYDGPNEDLIIGKTYAVMGVGCWADESVVVYIHTVEENDCPYPYPIEMFDLVDSSLNVDWCVRFRESNGAISIGLIGFSEWVEDDTFYERLVDGDVKAIAIYHAQRLKSENY